MNDALDRAAVDRVLELAGKAEAAAARCRTDDDIERAENAAFQAKHAMRRALDPATVAALCRGWVERDDLRRRLEGLLAPLVNDRGKDGHGHGTAHSDPADCPIWYDWCNCTVAALECNIVRADAARSERDDLRALLAEAWTPTSENVNALPAPVRQYVHDIETRCDPAGEVQQRAALQESVAGLSALLAEARAAHDAQTAQHVRDVDAANERAERMREALETFMDLARGEPLLPTCEDMLCDFAWCLAVRAGHAALASPPGCEE